MAAVYDTQVRIELEKYDNSLKDYPISPARRKEKVKRLRSFLQSLSKDFSSNPICNSKKLGQGFNSANEPIDKSLRHSHYEDESGIQWRMSFLQVSKNVVKIYRLYQAQFVDETLKRIKFDNNTMEKNKQVIRLTESDLHRIISESVKSVLSELDWKTYASAAEKQNDYNSPKPKGHEYRHFQDRKGERAYNRPR